MVSIDHFRHLLMSQIHRAWDLGRIDICINSGELHRSFGNFPRSIYDMPECCDAMQDEMKPGDINVAGARKWGWDDRPLLFATGRTDMNAIFEAVATSASEIARMLAEQLATHVLANQSFAVLSAALAMSEGAISATTLHPR